MQSYNNCKKNENSKKILKLTNTRENLFLDNNINIDQQ